jgi:hypothetical protein
MGLLTRLAAVCAAFVLLTAAAEATPSKAQAMVCEGGNASQGTSITPTFGSNVTSGNGVIVLIRDGSVGGYATGVTDDRSTSYTRRTFGQDSALTTNLEIYSGVLGSSGANTVTVTFSGTDYVAVCIIEVTGIDGADFFEAAVTGNGSGTTDNTVGGLTTAAAEAYVVCGASEPAFNSYTAGTDYTLLDGTIPTNPNDFFGVQEYIPAGTLSSYTSHITASTSGTYVMSCAAFNAGSGGGSPPATPKLPLLGVGE